MHLSTLGLPSGNCSCVEAIAKTCDRSTDEELRPAEARCLDNLSNREERQTHQHGLLATDLVADQDGQDRGEETSQVPDADGETLQVCDIVFIWATNRVGLRELAAEGRYCEDASKISLVVTE